MIMLWFALMGGAVGAWATRTSLRMRHALNPAKERDWWLLLVLGWLPLACWFLAQFVTQD